MFKRKPYERRPVVYTPISRQVKVTTIGTRSIEIIKPSAHRDKRIRESARGEECLMRLPGCPGIAERTIWSHYRGGAGGKGMGLKAHDICGCYACTYCDAIYDGQLPRPAGLTLEEVEREWFQSHIRSLGRLHEKGLI